MIFIPSFALDARHSPGKMYMPPSLHYGQLGSFVSFAFGLGLDPGPTNFFTYFMPNRV